MTSFLGSAGGGALMNSKGNSPEVNPLLGPTTAALPTLSTAVTSRSNTGSIVEEALKKERQKNKRGETISDPDLQKQFLGESGGRGSSFNDFLLRALLS